MGKRVARPATALTLEHDSGTEALFNCGQNSVLAKLAHAAQHLELELAPEHRCIGEHAVARFGKTGEAPSDHVAHAFGNSQFGDRLRVADPSPFAAVQTARLDQVTEHFLDEERVALGL